MASPTMEVSALRYSAGAAAASKRSPLLKLQTDERLVAMIRRGNVAAFEALVSRYESRLLAFCRHLLNSREDAEDVLQESMVAAYNAMIADDRPINVRPWLYRIARNRCLNHMRKASAVGVDSMDIHFSDNGASTADKVHDREEFRQLVADIGHLPETQRTALVLREMDALSYEQIAEAMDTTVSSVKSLLVRARVSLAEATEARNLTCEEVRDELGEVAAGLIPRLTPPVRRHVKSCTRCEAFQAQIKRDNKVLAALAPVGLFAAFKQLLLAHLGHSTGTAAGGAATAGGTSAAAGGAAASGGGAGFFGAGVTAIAGKAAAGIAAAALVTAGTVVATHSHSAAPPLAGPAVKQALSSGATKAGASSDIAAPVTQLKTRPVAGRLRHHHGIVKTRHNAAHSTAPVVANSAAAGTTTTPVAATTTVPATTSTSTTPIGTTTTTTTTTGTTTTTTESTTLPTATAPAPTSTTPTSTTGGAGVGGPGGS